MNYLKLKAAGLTLVSTVVIAGGYISAAHVSITDKFCVENASELSWKQMTKIDLSSSDDDMDLYYYKCYETGIYSVSVSFLDSSDDAFVYLIDEEGVILNSMATSTNYSSVSYAFESGETYYIIAWTLHSNKASSYYISLDDYAEKGWVHECVYSGRSYTGDCWKYFDGSSFVNSGSYLIEGKRYFFDSNGEMEYGWKKYEDNWFFYDPNVKSLVPVIGLQKIGDDWYYVEDNFAVEANCLHRIDGITYYFGKDGKMCKGWVQFGNCWYFMDREDGTMKTGWISDVDGQKYFLDSSGMMVTGWMKNSEDKWIFLKSSGAMAIDWAKAGDKWYFFDKEGIMQTGWKQLGGVWYYLDASNGDMATGWKQVGNTWYFFDENGQMKTGWITINGASYYLNDSGAMVTGWRSIGGSWYYFNVNGSMAKGWVKLSGVWYYLEDNGKMVTGSKTINGKTYEFASSGACTNP